MVIISSRQIGEVASKLLVPGTTGRILAAFSGAAYLETGHGHLVWLCSEASPMHPRAVQLASSFPVIAAGADFFSSGQYINFPPNCSLSLADSHVWRATHTCCPLEIDKAGSKIINLFHADLFIAAKGFGIFIPAILSACRDPGYDIVLTDPLLNLAWPSVKTTALALQRNDFHTAFHSAVKLIGLGPGLTPSGDDFLTGLLFTLTILQRAYPRHLDIESCYLNMLLDAARHGTHLISYTLLADAACGQAVEPLHDFCNSILCDASDKDIFQSMSRLTQIGHSSGWDLLAGAFAGFTPVLPYSCNSKLSADLHQPAICA